MMKQTDNSRSNHEGRTDIRSSLRMQNLQHVMLPGAFLAFKWTN
jgi:hypothetical protein